MLLSIVFELEEPIRTEYQGRNLV